VRSGALGRVHRAEAEFSFDGDPDAMSGNYRLDASRGGGALYDVGCYAVDAVRWALTAGALDVASAEADVHGGVDLRTSARLIGPDGAVAEVRCGIRGRDEQLVAVYGEDATLVLGTPAFTARDAACQLHVVPVTRSVGAEGPADPAVGPVVVPADRSIEEFGPVDPYRLMVEALSRAVRGEDEWLPSAQDSLDIATVLGEVRARCWPRRARHERGPGGGRRPRRGRRARRAGHSRRRDRRGGPRACRRGARPRPGLERPDVGRLCAGARGRRRHLGGAGPARPRPQRQAGSPGCARGVPRPGRHADRRRRRRRPGRALPARRHPAAAGRARGQSWGGNVVLSAAAEHAGQVDALALVDGGWLRFDTDEPFESLWRRMAPPRWGDLTWEEARERIGASVAGWGPHALPAIMANLTSDPDGDPAGRVRNVLDLAAHEQILRSLYDADPRELYPSVSVPVLLAPAGGGPASALLEEALAGLPDPRLRRYDGAHHDLHLQHPERLAADLLALLDELSLASLPSEEP
jgi:pimeloyl-ACP methyl ester carboxylesterase